MNDLLRFAILGLGAGAVYGLLGQGIVVIYRGSGIVNFAQGAMAMVGAFVYWDLHRRSEWPIAPALVVAVALSAAIGALTHLLLMRPMRRAAPLTRLIATLAVLSMLTAGANLRWSSQLQVVPSDLPQRVWTVGWFGLDFTLTSDRIYLLLISVAVTALLWATFRFTRFGLGVSAAAENERAAAALGWSPDRLSTASWAIGGGLAGVGGVFVVPLTSLQVEQLTLIVLAALAAALAAGFSSFPGTLVAGLGIGVLQSELARYGSDLFGDVGQQGIAASLPFAIIIVVLVVRGRGLPLRSHVLERLPRLGPGSLRPLPLSAGAIALAAGVVLWFSPKVNAAVLAMLLAAIVIVSLVVLVGYAGQLSLAQFALAGMGAWFAGRLVSSWGWPFELALPAGVLGAMAVGAVFAVPALRTRGVNLAVVTMGLGFALEQVIFSNYSYTGGLEGTHVGGTRFLGIDLDPIRHRDRYIILVLVALVLVAVAATNLRRGRSGRRLVAVRANERAAASLGVSVFGAKLYAFVVSAGIAGLGGVLIGFQHHDIVYANYGTFASINVVLEAVIGGIGYVAGALFGSQFAPGGLGTVIVEAIIKDPGQWLVLASGIVVAANLIGYPDGLAAFLAERRRRRATPPARPGVDVGEVRRVPPRVLAIEDLHVRLGAVEILRGVDITLEPGTVVGLIGPNGAGKTMLIDAVTGFVRPSRGTITLGGADLTDTSPTRRARAGIVRSFQSLELFEDLTVLDNIRAASDPRDRLAYLTDLARPSDPPLPAAAAAAVREFGLGDDLDRLPDELSYGQRRLAAIARSVATEPSVLLLDEPAAGLSEAESRELAVLVRRLADDWGIAVLLVEHDVGMILSVCDQVTVLDFGAAIATGTPDAIRHDPAVRAAYLGEPDPGVRPTDKTRVVGAAVEVPTTASEVGS